MATDTSVAVAALLPWHVSHLVSREAIEDAVIPAHAVLETYSVLTRLPEPLSAGDASELLRRNFDAKRMIVLSPESQMSLVHLCAKLGVRGGAVYDALIALTVKEHDGTLLTRDRRASTTYERIGVEYRFVE